MAAVFLSYRRTDSPQACRVYDWLAMRLGEDALFMDVRAIPLAVAFPDFIKEAIRASRVVVVLIGAGWLERIHGPDDPVRMEVETAIEAAIPVLPVLIGATRMPDLGQLPASLAVLAAQNAAVVGVLHDFDTHMRMLWPRLEALVDWVATRSPVAADPGVIGVACDGIVASLRDAGMSSLGLAFNWQVFGSSEFFSVPQSTVSLYLHRVVHRSDSLELHVLLSFWTNYVGAAQNLVGQVIRHFDHEPVVPTTYFRQLQVPVRVKIRRSDEDPRQVWKMVTDQPLQLSLAYVATVSVVVAPSASAAGPAGA
jgi:TIR domain/Pvc16 N-terminal domain